MRTKRILAGRQFDGCGAGKFRDAALLDAQSARTYPAVKNFPAVIRIPAAQCDDLHRHIAPHAELFAIGGYHRDIARDGLKHGAADGRVFRAVAWRSAEKQDQISENRTAIDVAFSLEQNQYNGETCVELTLADIRPAQP